MKTNRNTAVIFREPRTPIRTQYLRLSIYSGLSVRVKKRPNTAILELLSDWSEFAVGFSLFSPPHTRGGRKKKQQLEKENKISRCNIVKDSSCLIKNIVSPRVPLLCMPACAVFWILWARQASLYNRAENGVGVVHHDLRVRNTPPHMIVSQS